MPDLKGGVLRPSAGVEQEYLQAILPLVRRMCDETRKALTAVFEEHATDSAMDGNPSSQARITLAALLRKYEQMFNRVARKATKRMIQRTLKHSTVTLGMSLKDIAKDFTLKTDFLHTDRMQEVITAATTEATGLIKLIPQKYISDVQGQVMRSITAGQGLKDLVPYLNAKYDGNVKHAKWVAMDQTRKSYSNINAARLQAAGVKEFIWLHVGGSQEPRPLHIALSGQKFRFDDPPVIGVMYGVEVRGKPGDLPRCRCLMRPVLNFGD
jgi:SPP1 gp7 family putative phage head morphogenesis protein